MAACILWLLSYFVMNLSALFSMVVKEAATVRAAVSRITAAGFMNSFIIR
jgi:hypothetical protein